MNDARATLPGILFALPWPITAIGGVNQVVENLIREAKLAGTTRPLLLEYSTSDERATLASKNGETPVIKLRVPVPLSPPRVFRSALSFITHLPRTLRSLREILQTHRITLVNVHYPTLAALHFSLLQELRLYGGKLVLSFHGLDIRNAGNTRGLEKLAWRYLLRSADGVVACSHALGAELIAFEPLCRDHLTVIHNGVDANKLLAGQSGSARRPPPCREPYVLSVGTFEHKKGQDVLLQAFARLAPDHATLRLVLVGRSTPYLSSLKKLTLQLGLQERVDFHADVPHDEIASIFASATVFCLPSRLEPFGIVLLEAALFEVPVVASAVGGVTEIVRPGIDGVLVPPDDPDALEIALRTALTRDDECRRQSASLKSRVLSDFTWRGALDKYLALT